MAKIELTIAPNYVPSWTIVDAVRELFQNALDQEKQNPDNIARWHYDEQAETLTISNDKSTLTAKSLLLGQTTKADDATTIGQFGEGYKIATLVLLRNGKQVTFYNYGAREIWRPRFVRSRRFGTDILTFFTEKPAFWATVPSADLVVEIAGITADEYYNLIVPSNLHLRKDYNLVESTKFGDIIDIPGKVFVNGLYVCDYEPYKYGYNFKPEYIKLDRDRKMVSDFDLCWLASKMWCVAECTDKAIALLVDGAADVAYLKEVTWLGSTQWAELALTNFRSVYGPEAVPVSTQQELENVPAGYVGIIVPAAYGSLITSSASFEMPESDDPSPLDELLDWFGDIKDKLTDDEIHRFDTIITNLNSQI